MKIYILRHGEASFTANSDAARPLTEFGILQAQKVGLFFKEHQIYFDFAFVSPYLRAQETFETLLPFTSVNKTLIESQLTPNGNEQIALGAIFGYLNTEMTKINNESCILLVSHLPLVCELVSALTSSHQRPMFATAELACIDFNLTQSNGTLLWMKQLYH